MNDPAPPAWRPGPLPPPSVRTVGATPELATRIVLIRHGEGRCNAEGVVGGPVGCRGLTDRGRAQVEALAARLASTGELADVGALYASTLPRAIETAQLLAPALERWRSGPALSIIEDEALCEMHPGEADGLSWEAFAERFEIPDWDVDPTTPLAPGAESWDGFIERAAAAAARLAQVHPGELVVVACHAGVIEATMRSFLPLIPSTGRLKLRTEHASVTEWEYAEERWLLRHYNHPTFVPPSAAGQQA